MSNQASVIFAQCLTHPKYSSWAAGLLIWVPKDTKEKKTVVDALSLILSFLIQGQHNHLSIFLTNDKWQFCQQHIKSPMGTEPTILALMMPPSNIWPTQKHAKIIHCYTAQENGWAQVLPGKSHILDLLFIGLIFERWGHNFHLFLNLTSRNGLKIPRWCVVEKLTTSLKMLYAYCIILIKCKDMAKNLIWFKWPNLCKGRGVVSFDSQLTCREGKKQVEEGESENETD